MDGAGPVAHRSDMTPWAEMLSMIGRKNCQLYDFLVQTAPPRNRGSVILRELERERSRIARELHAGAGQPLAGIKLNLEMLDECVEALPQPGREALARLESLADQALQQIRAVSHSLHPPEWQNLTAAEALRGLVESIGLDRRMTVEINIEPLPAEPPHAAKIALYRCAQECISNIVRHSGATAFRLSLAPRGAMMQLRIEDNGHGFNGDMKGNGIGLQALREHAAALAGSCEITSGPEGTVVAVQLPLTED